MAGGISPPLSPSSEPSLVPIQIFEHLPATHSSSPLFFFDYFHANREKKIQGEGIEGDERGCFSSTWAKMTAPQTLISVSQFLASWGDRMWQFAAPILFTEIFTESLFAAMLYPLISSLVVFLFGPLAGNLVDKTKRLTVVRVTLLVQNICLIGTGAIIVFLQRYQQPTFPYQDLHVWGLFLSCCLLGAIAEVAAVSESISVGKDWAVVICNQNEAELVKLNSRLRLIDLTCDILAPVGFSLVLQYSGFFSAILMVLIWNVLSVLPEYFMLSWVYHSVPSLAIKAKTPKINEFPENEEKEKNLENPLVTLLNGWKLYVNHEVFYSSLAYVVLYITILSGGPAMTAYLNTIHIGAIEISLWRGLCAIGGMSATFAMPKMFDSFGVLKSGVYFLLSQIFFLIPGVTSFMLFDKYGTEILMICIAFSRFGLWGYDLCQVQIMQSSIDQKERGIVNGTEQSLTQIANILILFLGTIFSQPSQFGILAIISVVFVGLANICFSRYIYLQKKKKGDS